MSLAAGISLVLPFINVWEIYMWTIGRTKVKNPTGINDVTYCVNRDVLPRLCPVVVYFQKFENWALLGYFAVGIGNYLDVSGQTIGPILGLLTSP